MCTLSSGWLFWLGCLNWLSRFGRLCWFVPHGSNSGRLRCVTVCTVMLTSYGGWGWWLVVGVEEEKEEVGKIGW